MEITLIGTGSPELGPNNIRAGASATIKIGNEIFLFDCGRWITLRLCEAGIHPNQITRLFLTHLFHLDHTESYYDFLFSHGDNPISQKLSIYGPPGTKEYTEKLLDFHAKYGDTDRTKRICEFALKNSHDYKERGTICSGDVWKVIAVNIDEKTNWPPTIVYRVEYDNLSVVVAWDIHPRHPRKRDGIFEFDDTYTSRQELMDLMKEADIVLADAMEIHTTPEGVGIAAKKAGVKKVVLTHLTGPGVPWQELKPTEIKERVKKIFDGEVIIGKDLERIEI